jgi:hypothetical protein
MLLLLGELEFSDHAEFDEFKLENSLGFFCLGLTPIWSNSRC